MIDILKAREEFAKYVKKYDETRNKIARKIAHTYRTEEVARQIAESLDLDEENILLARLIGLLHDIGRFEQLRIYDTYSDIKSIDHADFGVKLLFEDGMINNFISDRKYDEIIYKAIKNHNKLQIEEGLNEIELLHAKIIRDADKTDIIATSATDIIEDRPKVYNYEIAAKQTITPEVLEDFKKFKPEDRRKGKNEMDEVLVLISLVYDFYFKKGLEIIAENKYIETVIQELEKMNANLEQTKFVKETIINYINQTIKR